MAICGSYGGDNLFDKGRLQMKSLFKYLKEDFSDWRNDPLYHGGLWEDLIVGAVAFVLLVGFILWQL